MDFVERASPRLRNAVEVVVAYGLLEGALWSTRGRQLAWALLLLGWVLVTTLRAKRSSDELGVGRRGFRESLWVIAGALAACLVIVVAAWWAGTLHSLTGARAPLWHAGLYAIWALVQEFLTMSYILVRMEGVAGGTGALWITTGLFCLAHIPNVALMVLTLAMSATFCWIFQRYRNIYPLALAHAMLGLTLSITVSSSAVHYMRVGMGYWR